MRIFACVYWEGKFRGREKVYSPEWVYILKAMCERSTNAPFKFVCLTNVPDKFDETVETIPLLHNWRGWWSKLELFRSDLFEEGDRVFYLDLDSVIVGNIEPFFNFKSDFAIMRSLDTKRFGRTFVDVLNSNEGYNFVYVSLIL